MRIFALSCALAAVLAGCAGSPPARYYTLVAPVSAEAPPAAGRSYMIDVVPVSVPGQVDQPQLMLRDGAGQLVPYYSDRWSAALPDEFRSALSDVLTRELGVPDVQVVQPPPGTQVWRVQADVQRFDATLAGPIVLDATWRVRPVGGERAEGGGLLCRTRVETAAAAPTVASVVEAQQQAVRKLGRTIASAVAANGTDARAAEDGVQLLGCTQFKG